MKLFKKNLYNAYSLIWGILLVFSSLITFFVAAEEKNEFYSAEQLSRIAEKFIADSLPTVTEGHREIKALPLDSRIKQRKCSLPLTIAAPNRKSLVRQSTVHIKCNDNDPNKHWNQYVNVRVTELIPIVVARKNLFRGQVLSENDLTTELQSKNRIQPGQQLELSSLIGSRLKRAVRQSQPVYSNQVCTVCDGERVTVVAKLKNMQIKTSGTALQDGALGQSIAIKNNKSGKVIYATVRAVNYVEVNI